MQAGRTLKSNSQISNYFSHIKTKKRTCDIVNHFIDKHAETWKEKYEENKLFFNHRHFTAKIPPSNKEEKLKRMKEFEGYLQVKVGINKTIWNEWHK